MSIHLLRLSFSSLLLIIQEISSKPSTRDIWASGSSAWPVGTIRVSRDKTSKNFVFENLAQHNQQVHQTSVTGQFVSIRTYKIVYLKKVDTWTKLNELFYIALHESMKTFQHKIHKIKCKTRVWNIGHWLHI